MARDALNPLRPLQIGSVRLPNNLMLSPMAGYSDLPFRILCREHGAGLVSSEMVAASSVERGIAPHLVRMRTAPEERPTSIQLFGTDPETVAAAARIADPDCDVLGFNMGCPADQIRVQGCGAALLDRPELAADLVRAIKGASRKPLLVKMRAGNARPMDVAAFGRRLEAAGADGLLLHARTAAQYYSGRADWSLVRDLKQAVSIPVVGNGDVSDGPSALRAFESSGCDGVALGRATLGDPRIFDRIAHFLTTGEQRPAPSPSQRAADFLRYLDLAQGLPLGVNHILQQAQRFTKGLSGGAAFRQTLRGAGTPLEHVRSQFERLREGWVPSFPAPAV